LVQSLLEQHKGAGGGRQPLDFFHDADVALEREFYAAGGAQAEAMPLLPSSV
jgi:hypothetical protein